MKISPLILFLIALLLSPARAQSPFELDWKLRLTKGYTWRQNAITHTVSVAKASGQRVEVEVNQTLDWKNEVLDATPSEYSLRLTYTRFEQTVTVKVNGKTQPTPKFDALNRAFVGAVLLIKQAPNGRVSDVTGLEELVERQKNALLSLAQNEAHRAEILRALPSASALRQTIIQNQSQVLPRQILRLGDSYSYAVDLPRATTFGVALRGKRTLRAFDGFVADLDESATFDTAPVQVGGPTSATVLLTRDAAQLYLAQKHRQKPGAETVYLSRNGRLYYREAGKPQNVVWLDPPPNGLRVSPGAGAPFRAFIGYNNRNTGQTVQSRFIFNGQTMPRPPASNEPVAVVAPKTFVTWNGKVSGVSTVSALSGLVLMSDLSIKMRGRTSVIEANGRKVIVPFEASVAVLARVMGP